MQLLSMIRIVLWSFFGIRKRASHEADFAKVNFIALPFVAVIIAVVIWAVLFGAVHLLAGMTSSAQGF